MTKKKQNSLLTKTAFILKKIISFFTNISIIVIAIICIIKIYPVLVSLNEENIEVSKIESKIDYLINLREGSLKDIRKYYMSTNYNGINVYAKNNFKTWTQTRNKVAKEIYKNSIEFTNLSPNLIIAASYQESGFRKYSTSNIDVKDKYGNSIRVDHALGYMQIYYKIWEDIIPIDSKKAYDEEENIYWGCYILKLNLDKENENLQTTMIRYNGGRKTFTSDNKTIINTDSGDYADRVIKDYYKLGNYKNTNEIVAKLSLL